MMGNQPTPMMGMGGSTDDGRPTHDEKNAHAGVADDGSPSGAPSAAADDGWPAADDRPASTAIFINPKNVKSKKVISYLFWPYSLI